MAQDTAAPLEILHYPHPFLGKRARALTPADIKAGQAEGWNLAELAERMKATTIANNGVGLAAPQVGVGLRLIIVDLSKHDGSLMVVLNPVLSEMHGAAVEEEGCLSVPEVRAKVKRYTALKFSGVDITGAPISIVAEDLLARVFQHETDHLDGVLFINRLGMTARLMVRKQLAELEGIYELRQKRKKP